MILNFSLNMDFDPPLIMGILNVTPDSFLDGGEYATLASAVDRAFTMVAQGADIIDVGGESTGPESLEVSLEEELNRVIPVIRAIHERDPQIKISIDTWKAEVARQAIQMGASMVNDVTALRGDSSMASVVAKADVPVVLMYSKDNTPRTTKKSVHYHDVVRTICSFLSERMAYAETQGIHLQRIFIDPGMGAFVSADSKYSFEILDRLAEFKVFGCPILVGASRKSFLGGIHPRDRLKPSLEAAFCAVRHGASIVRVHDVRETVQRLRKSAI